MKKFYVLVSVYLILVLLDGLVTYIHTPDLALEGNPLVYYLGFGWGALFISNFIGFVLVVCAAYNTFVRYETIICSARNRREYSSYIFYNRLDKFEWLFIPHRNKANWKPAWAMLGYGFVYTLIIHRIILVSEWIFNMPALYRYLDRLLPFGQLLRLSLVISFFVITFCMWLWFEKEYRAFRANNEKEI